MLDNTLSPASPSIDIDYCTKAPSHAQWDAARQDNDPLADDLVRQLYETYDPKEVGQLYTRMMSKLDKLNYDELPPMMAEYFKNNQKLPKWADLKKIKMAEDLFFTMGPEMAISLLCRALPIGYVSENVNKVLTSTGYLASDKKLGSAKRLMETTQFIIDCLAHDNLRPNNKGIDSILKVRLIHAMSRYHLLKHGWDGEKYGVPINQEDMSATILTFSISCLQGMEYLNIKLSDEQKDALTHFWAVVGDLIGLRPDLNPTDYKTGEEMYMTLLERAAKESDTGKLLIEILAGFIKDVLQLKPMPNFQQHLLSFMIHSDKYSKILNLAQPKNFYEKISSNTGIGTLRFLNKNKGNPLADVFSKPLNQFLAKRLISYFENEFKLYLEIPIPIRKSWGLALPKN